MGHFSPAEFGTRMEFSEAELLVNALLGLRQVDIQLGCYGDYWLRLSSAL
jgi:hypothetical protein